jgi:hypothetical protein
VDVNLITALMVWTVAVPETMPVQDVKHGQKGVCHTVFEGTQIEEMAFEVKGVMPGYLGPGSDLIVIKLLGEKPSFTGVVAGMSGSPCMIDGKLIGALGYSFASFAKEPIAGVTPVQNMLDIFQRPDEKLPWRYEQRASWMDGAREQWALFKKGEHPSSMQPSFQGAQPIASPVMVSGVSPEILQNFAGWFEAMGWLPAAGGAASSTAGPPSLLQPGDAVAALLVRGDVNMAATGTVTWNDGRRLLAFGHPFMGHGAVSFPMAGAVIINTMASSMRSFKMSVPTQVVGELVQDRSSAIAGVMGSSVQTVPVRGVLHAYGKASRFSFEVARDVYLTPRLLSVALSGALAKRVDAGARGTLRWSAQILSKGYPALTVQDIAVAQQDNNLFAVAGMAVADVFASLWFSPMSDAPPLMEVVLDAAFTPDPLIESVERISLERSLLHPGDVLHVQVHTVQPNTSRSTVQVEIPVQASWINRTLKVYAGGADAWLRHVFSKESGGSPRTLGEWIDIQKAQQAPSDRVYVWVVCESVGLGHRGSAMPMLPPSVVAVWKADGSWVGLQEAVVWKESFSRQGAVVGVDSVSFDVKPSWQDESVVGHEP